MPRTILHRTMRFSTALYALLSCTTLSLAADASPPVSPPATRPVQTQPATQPATASAADASLARFPTYGAAFALPAGWNSIPREKSGRIGQWISPESKPADIKALIMIETGRPGQTSPMTMAQSLARNFGGAVMDDPTTLGGEPALLVRADNHDDELAPVEGLVCIHEGTVFLIMGGITKGKSVHAEIEQIRTSWKWLPVEKPAQHLAFRDQAFEAFGSVKLNVPEMMHANASDDPDTQLDLSIHNMARNSSDFRVSMTLAKLPPGVDFEKVKERFLADLMEKYKFVTPPTWQERKGATPRMITPVVEAARPQPADTDTLHHQWAVVNLGEASGRALLIHFTHEAETDEERQRFEKAVEAILESITPIAKPAKAPAEEPRTK